MAKKATAKSASLKKSPARRVMKTEIRRSPIPKKTAKAAPATKKSPVRNSSIPKKAAAPMPAAAPRLLTYELIARRAFEIHCGGTGGDEFHNWVRAESELRHELGL